MQTSRRAFLAYVAALGAAAALPAPAAGVPAREFGFTFDGSLFQTGFPDRASAIAAAGIDRPNAAFRTAEIAFHALRYPEGLGLQAGEWLLNGGRLGNVMVDWLTCANEDGDFEGEFTEACNAVSRAPLGDAGRAAIRAALARAGAAELAGAVAAEECFEPRDVDEAVLDALEADAALAAELRSAFESWTEAESLAVELRGLSTRDEVDHPALAAAA